jgi:alpha-beta hydrolase superfamily lysophospholipase
MPEVPLDPAILSRDPAVGQAYADDPLVWHGPFKRPTLESLFGSMDVIASADGLGDLPTLWIHGEEDGFAPLGHTREAIERLRGPGLEEKVYLGARHEVFNETNSDEVLADVIDFIRRSLAL